MNIETRSRGLNDTKVYLSIFDESASRITRSEISIKALYQKEDQKECKTWVLQATTDANGKFDDIKNLSIKARFDAPCFR